MPLFGCSQTHSTLQILVIDPHSTTDTNSRSLMSWNTGRLRCPVLMRCDLLALLGSISRYVIKKIHRRDDGESQHL